MTLVGAGPGDPGLITRPRLSGCAPATQSSTTGSMPEELRRRSAGGRAAHLPRRARPDQVNRLLVELSRELDVVRLKAATRSSSSAAARRRSCSPMPGSTARSCPASRRWRPSLRRRASRSRIVVSQTASRSPRRTPRTAPSRTTPGSPRPAARSCSPWSLAPRRAGRRSDRSRSFSRHGVGCRVPRNAARPAERHGAARRDRRPRRRPSGARTRDRGRRRRARSAARSDTPDAERVELQAPMELRRIDSLPPYVFATIRDLTLELRRAGEDVVDLGFSNPDLPSPGVASRSYPRPRRSRATTATRRRRGSRSCASRAPTCTGAGSASSSTTRRRW